MNFSIDHRTEPIISYKDIQEKHEMVIRANLSNLKLTMFAVSSGQTLLLLYNAITHILATQSSCIIFYLNMCYAIYLEHLFPPQEELGQRTAKEMHSNYRS